VTDTIVFKDWLPDQPDLGNPGLIDAKNCIPVDGTFKSFLTLDTSIVNETLPGIVTGSFGTYETTGSFVIFAGTLTNLYRYETSGGFSDRSATTYNAQGEWRWAQYEDIVIAANGNHSPQYITINSAGNFATLGSSSGTAPAAVAVGKVGQFVVLGYVAGVSPAYIRWSAIDNPLSWPTPGSSTALATQAGEQYLDEGKGPVTSIAGGDLSGLIFQLNAITRMTYIGGSAVFQFDDLHAGRGAWFANATVQAGGATYFIAQDGIFRTNGVQIEAIGDGKVNRWFQENAFTGFPNRVYGAFDRNRNLIYWAFPDPTSSGQRPSRILIYNIGEGRFSYAVQNLFLIASSPGNQGFPYAETTGGMGIIGYSTTNALGYFSGTPGTAIFETGEIEGQPGGYSHVSGVKPLIDVTANAATVALGTRGDLQSSVTYTSETTANSRSGFCDFRSEARYHRARLTVTGTFNAAQGLHFTAGPAGQL
jgi:hypothetical protein